MTDRLVFADDGRDRSWMPAGLCRGMDPQHAARVFFPVQGESQAPARAVCADCPVRAACLDYGMDENYGVWGGTSERERRRLRRLRGAA